MAIVEAKTLNLSFDEHAWNCPASGFLVEIINVHVNNNCCSQFELQSCIRHPNMPYLIAHGLSKNCSHYFYFSCLFSHAKYDLAALLPASLSSVPWVPFQWIRASPAFPVLVHRQDLPKGGHEGTPTTRSLCSDAKAAKGGQGCFLNCIGVIMTFSLQTVEQGGVRVLSPLQG